MAAKFKCMLNIFIGLFVMLCYSCNVQKPMNHPVAETQDSAIEKFGQPFAKFEIMVPNSYKHQTQIDSFVGSHYQFVDIVGYYADRYFKNASNNLVPGKTYEVRFYPINARVTSEECIEFLKSKKAIFVNAQGLTLVWDLRKGDLPKDYGWILSFDEKDALPRSPDVKFEEINIPMMGFHSTKVWQLGYYGINTNWTPNFACLMAFFELEETTR